jgi:hypothetical protein
MLRAEFDGLSPVEVGELTRAWKQKQKREDMRAGVLAALTANLHRDPKRQTKPYEPGDFFPGLRPRDSRPKAEQLKQALEAWVGQKLD